MTLDVTGLTPELLEKYDRPGPRYTSYPTAPQFSADFHEAAYRERLELASRRADENRTRVPSGVKHVGSSFVDS